MYTKCLVCQALHVEVLSQTPLAALAFIRLCFLMYSITGVPNSSTISWDGFLHLIQSDWRDDRSIYCTGAFSVKLKNGILRLIPVVNCFMCTSGAHVAVRNSSSYSICGGLCHLCTGKLPVTNRNQRTSFAGEKLSFILYVFYTIRYF